jgi:nucleoid DNA-binding protein
MVNGHFKNKEKGRVKNKKDIIKQIHQYLPELTHSKKTTKAIVDVFLEIIEDSLLKNEEVLLREFGKFHVGKSKSRTVFLANRMKKPKEIPAYAKPSFKFSLKLRDRVRREIAKEGLWQRLTK